MAGINSRGCTNSQQPAPTATNSPNSISLAPTAAGAICSTPEAKVSEGPLSELHATYRYLRNNASRTDYVSYCKAGLPATSAEMESQVKQIGQRVKWIEMFWNDSQRGGEVILQLRSSYLCDDDRPRHNLRHRPSYPFVRRTTKSTTLMPTC